MGHRRSRPGVCNWLAHGAHAGTTPDPHGVDGIFLRFDDFETEEHTTTHFTDDLDAHSLEQTEGYATKGWLEETSRQQLVQEYGSGFTFVFLGKAGKVMKQLTLDFFFKVWDVLSHERNSSCHIAPLVGSHTGSSCAFWYAVRRTRC